MKFLRILKRNIGGVLIVVCFLAAVCASLTTYAKNKYAVTIPVQYTVDPALQTTEADVYTTEGISLPKGTYRVSVTYRSDADRNYVYAKGTTVGYRKFLHDRGYLNHQTERIEYDVWAFEEATDVQFTVRYRGSGALSVNAITIVQNNKLVKLYLTLTGLVMLLVCAVYTIVKRGIWKNMRTSARVATIAIVFTALYATYPGFSTGMYASDDMPFHLLRLEGLAQALSEGQCPVRMQSIWAYGHGYPVSTYYCDLLMYFPAFLRMMGMPLQVSFTMYALLVNALTALFSFLAFRKVAKNNYAGTIAMVMYTLAPMRISQLFPRGAIGEATAYTFLPLVLVGIYMLYVTNEKNGWKYLTAGFTGLITCHVITTYLTGLFCIITALVFIKKTFRKDTLLAILKMVAAVLLLNAWFLVPFLSSLRDVSVGTDLVDAAHMQHYGLNLSQLFHMSYLSVGTVNFADAGPAGEDAFGIGFAVFFGWILYAIMLCAKKNGASEEAGERSVRCAGIYLFVISALTIYMTTCYFPWDRICAALGSAAALIYKIQFGFRFTKFAILFCCALAALALGDFPEKSHEELSERRIVAVASMAVCFVFSVFSASRFMDDFINNYETKPIYNATALGQTSQAMTEYMIPGTDVSKLLSTAEPFASGTAVLSYDKRGTTVSLDVMGEEDGGYVEIPVLWYPQYCVTEGSSPSAVTLVKGNNNVIRLNVPADFVGNVIVKYKVPMLWRVAECISVLAAMWVMGTGVSDTLKR